MRARKLVLATRAARDILEQASWYQEKEGSRLALRWEKAVTSALVQLTLTH